MPDQIRDTIGEIADVRRIYLEPAVTDDYEMTFSEPDVPGVIEFLCTEREFSRERISAALDRAFRPTTLW